ncbi:MAG: hypothetical protein AB7T06_30880 [Kofleriaceae bacterium]
MADGDEILKGAGRFFSKLGGQLKEAGGQLKEVGKTVGSQVVATSKQVTGLGRGSVKLELEQTKVAPGGTLKGKLVLAVTEPVEAKRVLVTLRARQRYIAVKRGDGGGVGSSHADVYQFDKELAPSGTFDPQQTFEFELVVPPDALELRPQQSAGGNPLADVARTIASAVTPNAGPIEWQVLGRLEISWGRDLSHDVDIVVAA